jgi:hypothetical protein
VRRQQIDHRPMIVVGRKAERRGVKLLFADVCISSSIKEQGRCLARITCRRGVQRGFVVAVLDVDRHTHVEKERDDAFKYLGFTPIGLRLGGQVALNDRTYLFGSAAAEWREYRDVDPFFLEEREDQQYSVTAGVHRLLADRWRVSPQVTWLLNESNIVINEYDRWQAFVSLRRDW